MKAFEAHHNEEERDDKYIGPVLKKKLEKEDWDEEDRWDLVMAFEDRIVRWARYYAWAWRADGVVSEEDLMQAGYLAAFELIPKCREREQLGQFLYQRLRGELRDEAKRQRGRKGYVEVDDEKANLGRIPELICEPDFEYSAEERRIVSFLRRHLQGGLLVVALLLYRGCTQTEAAKMLKLTRQAIGARVRRIRAILEPVLHEVIER